MPTLHDYQQAMAAWVLADRDAAGSASGIERWCSGPAPTSAARLMIYRNTALGTLVSALALNYPAVRRVVGADFFELAAHRYVRIEPPKSAYLNDYGAGFATFLAAFEPAAQLCYLAELARLEWSVSRALHAANAPALEFARLAQSAADPWAASRLRFVPHPSLSLLRLEYPADEIWRAVLAQDDAAMAGIDLTTGPVWLLIERAAAGSLQVRRLAQHAWRLTQQLCAGLPLSVAIEAGGESLQALLAEHLACGRFIDCKLDSASFDGPQSRESIA